MLFSERRKGNWQPTKLRRFDSNRGGASRVQENKLLKQWRHDEVKECPRFNWPPRLKRDGSLRERKFVRPFVQRRETHRVPFGDKEDVAWLWETSRHPLFEELIRDVFDWLFRDVAHLDVLGTD